jgi:hypothetical protein
VLIRDKVFGPKEKPEALGVDLAKRILASGGGKILQGIFKRIQESEFRIQKESSG